MFLTFSNSSSLIDGSMFSMKLIQDFAFQTYEGLSHFVGMASNIRDVLTHHILMDDTEYLIAGACIQQLSLKP